MPRIDEVFAYICDDTGPDDEGVIGINTAHGWMPLIGADVARVESIRNAARSVALLTKKKVKLVRFSNREVINEDILS